MADSTTTKQRKRRVAVAEAAIKTKSAKAVGANMKAGVRVLTFGGGFRLVGGGTRD